MLSISVFKMTKSCCCLVNALVLKKSLTSKIQENVCRLHKYTFVGHMQPTTGHSLPISEQCCTFMFELCISAGVTKCNMSRSCATITKQNDLLDNTHISLQWNVILWTYQKQQQKPTCWPRMWSTYAGCLTDWQQLQTTHSAQQNAATQ